MRDLTSRRFYVIFGLGVLRVNIENPAPALDRLGKFSETVEVKPFLQVLVDFELSVDITHSGPQSFRTTSIIRASSDIFATSSSVNPLLPVTVMACSFPVSRSRADTLTIPSELISKDTSISGSPALAFLRS